MESLLRNVRLQTHHLPRFLSLLQRDERLGSMVRNLTFLAFPKSMVDEKIKSNRTEATKVFEGIGVSSTQIKTLGSNLPLLARYLTTARELSLIPSPYWTQKDFKVNKGSTQFTITLTNLARAAIIDACPRLKSISTDDALIGFPFIKRTQGVNSSLRSSVALKGLDSVNLTTLNIRRVHGKPDSITASNAGWLLLNLPHLEKAHFSVSMHNADTKFSEDHKAVWKAKKSTVKNLHLSIFISMSLDEEQEGKGVYRLLEMTQGLDTLFLECTPDSTNVETPHSVLNGLYSSFDTLKTLGIVGIKFTASPQDHPLSLMGTLAHLYTDFFFLNGINPQLFQLKEYRESPSSSAKEKALRVMPPNLLKFSMVHNWIYGDFGEMFPEENLAGLLSFEETTELLELVEVPLKSRDLTGNNDPPIKSKSRWLRARNDLRQICLERGIRVRLVGLQAFQEFRK